ncbi:MULTISPECIES: flagellar export protein FliJ [Oceanobacillus]|uniref:Flagellar FliJ protein n=1 Tax=Oceanobacillus kimchii TaxID=746691 RepID=A0ABQ5TJV0_9BACI|nr:MULTISPECIES: flagellar export protein FliJ [Oceanobacillus]MBT2598708.1 flagellar export protein FliJ [Oceanobacillus sp. ISL-74]MBT2651627.1 flagellar export protein FliJ [Oceanobacillus sp. ISL-73]MCT1576276.1 flagellar export protein FliJ [Oceanobacillus kimchii]MCT2135913.1 flagellar export protein FliJ [Oceanobacillus kimchii]OEH54663.1 flagellar protein required for formation of basal body [Oceanobacillus sp. E9]
MVEVVGLNRIREIRENEKKVAQSAYSQSMETFEKIATELYNLLRTKESAEASFESYIQNTTSIEKIKEQAAYIEKLNQRIQSVQLLVQRARNDMEIKQEKLSNAYVEVKKFDKIIEFKQKNEIEEAKRKEANWMDEMSMQQYLSHKSR